MFHRKKLPQPDAIQSKEARFTELQGESDFATSMARNSIDYLELVDGDIQREQEEIAEYISRLTKVSEKLNRSADRNRKIVSNLKTLFCMEEPGEEAV